MTKAFTDRNKLIVQLVQEKKKSLSEIAKIFGLKSKGTIHAIYVREVKGIRRNTRRS